MHLASKETPLDRTRTLFLLILPNDKLAFIQLFCQLAIGQRANESYTCLDATAVIRRASRFKALARRRCWQWSGKSLDKQWF